MDVRTRAISLWLATTPATNYPPLPGNLAVDTVVVGGGIAGLSVAYELTAMGQRVALIEAARIAEATTGNTTAKVTSNHGLKYTQLLKKYTDDGVRLYGAANEAAIDRIEHLISIHKIDCDFSRLPAYTYAQVPDDADKVRAEAEAAARLGLPASYVADIPLPYKTYGGVMFANQAQFHVRKYLLALADMVVKQGGHIFEHTKATDIQPAGDKYCVVTERGNVMANDIVIATHEPFYDPDNSYSDFFKFHDFAIGVTINGEPPAGEFFSTGNEPHSIRSQSSPHGTILILGGKSEAETSAATPEEAYELTRKDYDDKFDIRDVLYTWTTYDLATDDGASCIGLLRKDQPHIYVATGFSGWGMTNGAAAGMILCDRITGKPNPWGSFFDPFEREQYARSS